MRLSEEDRLAWGDEQYDRWRNDGHIERKKTMTLSEDIFAYGMMQHPVATSQTEPSQPYKDWVAKVRKLEAMVQMHQRNFQILKGVLLEQGAGERSIEWWLENVEPDALADLEDGE